MNTTNEGNTIFVPLEKEVKTLRSEKQELLEEVKYLKIQVGYLKKLAFGTKRDRLPTPAEEHPNQRYLFETPVQVEEEPKEEEKAKTEKPKKKAKRKPVPRHLETVEIVLEAPPEKKVSPTGEAFNLLGYAENEKIHLVAAKFQRVVYKREQWGDATTREIKFTTPPPKCIIDKGKFTDEFIQEIILQKYFLSVPLYRQIQYYSTQGIELAKSTLSDAVKQFATFYEPIWKAIGREVFLEKYVMSDSTHIDCQGLQKETMKQTRFWGYRNEVGCYFVWGKTKSHSEILEVFKNLGWLEVKPSGGKELRRITWRGYLMADDDPAYVTALKGQKKKRKEEEEHFFSEVEIILLACWAHVRRKFVSIAEGELLAKVLAEAINEIYRLERKIAQERVEQSWSKEEFYEKREKLRQEKSAPLVNALLEKIDEEWNSGKYPPKSAMGKALAYAHHLEERLKVFLTDGELPIDNNGTERNIKGCVMGRKNYLFVGSEDAGMWAAICHSLIESCRQLGRDPRDYLAKSTRGLLEGKKAEELTPYAMREQVKAFPTNF